MQISLHQFLPSGDHHDDLSEQDSLNNEPRSFDDPLVKMAKSIRSKSLRKAKAVKCAAVFKPVDDARLKRLAEKLHTSMDGLANSSSSDAVMLAEDAVSLAGPTRYRNRKKLASFSAYGLYSKETRF